MNFISEWIPIYIILSFLMCIFHGLHFSTRMEFSQEKIKWWDVVLFILFPATFILIIMCIAIGAIILLIKKCLKY